MMRKYLLIPALGVLTACGGEADQASEDMTTLFTLTPLSGANVWTVDYELSSVGFEGVENGSPFDGEFNDFTAVIRLDPEDLSDAVIRAQVATQSVSTNDKDKMDMLPAKAWFNSAIFPVAKFESDTVEQTAPGEYAANGQLTIKDISQPVTLPFDLEVTGDDAVASGAFNLDRLDYDIGGGEYASEDYADARVTVFVKIYASRT